MSNENDPPSFWQRPEVRKLLPVAIGLVSLLLLLLTFALAPRRSRRFVPPAEQGDAPEAALVSVSQDDLRSGADPRSSSLAVLPRGEHVTILERRGLWSRVRDASKREGFLPTLSLEREADRAARVKRAETIFHFAPLSGDVAETTPFLLAPFSFAPIWGSADQGDSIDIYSVDHAFYAVKLPDGTLGFVASRDVDIVPANPAEPALVPGSGKVVRGISVSEENPPATPGPPASETPAPAVPSSSEPVPAPAPAAPPERTPIAPAVLIEKVDPIYPNGALAARATGTVVLQIGIDAQGNVTKVDVKREGLLGMTEAAVEAVSRWKYRPATGLNGPIPSIKQVKIEFQPPG